MEIIDESYLESGKAPLYHYTNIWTFFKIINENKLKVGIFENPYLNKKIKVISLSRNPNLDLSYYRDDLDTIIELDSNLLKNKNKIIPYDFFIHNRSENKPKSKISRISPVEFEEILFNDLDNITEYILSVNFIDDAILLPIFSNILPILKKNNIKILNDGKEITL